MMICVSTWSFWKPELRVHCLLGCTDLGLFFLMGHPNLMLVQELLVVSLLAAFLLDAYSFNLYKQTFDWQWQPYLWTGNLAISCLSGTVGRLDQGCPVVHYIDNDAAKASMIRGYGATEVAKRLVQRYVELEEQLQLKVWFSRVPSFSNLSDGPSRNDCSEVLAMGASQAICEWERFDRLLL